MIISSHQPNFLPYMGYFYKAFKSDYMVISDDVAFSKSSAHNWNYIYTSKGKTKITMPVHAHHDTALKDVRYADFDINLKKIIRTAKESYAKAEHYEEGLDLLYHMEMYASRWLSTYNKAIIEHIMNRFGIKTRLFNASSLGITGHKDERILMMCDILGADTYYSGNGARAYHIPELYKKKDIDLVYSDYKSPTYRQADGNIVENLSVLDYIFNMGYELPKEWT